MGFLSYAQNFEDVMLWRALGHVSNGVYVDIGAQHPYIDSISRAFYERGWRGVHVEPVPAYAEMLRQDRPEETVLQVALGEHEGVLALNVFADTGLSTAIPDYADRHQVERGYEVERIEVPMLTVKAALASLAGKQVHWLKIDVEGFEEQVLRGWDSAQLRPWILVIEATIPNSPQTNHEKWEPLVTAAGYRFVYFDGLNRFYIANEHPELAASFAVPPNIFDGVEVSGQASWGICNHAVAEHQARNAELAERVRVSETKEAAAAASIAGLNQAVASLSEQLARSHAAQQRVLELENLLGERDNTIKEIESTLREQVSRQRQLEAKCVEAVSKAEELKHSSYYWWHTAEELRTRTEQLRAELDGVYRSLSWRLSEPLRLVNARSGPARKFAGRVLRWTLRQPARLRNVVHRDSKDGSGVPVTMHASREETDPGRAANRPLSPRAARVYADLRQEVEKGSE